MDRFSLSVVLKYAGAPALSDAQKTEVLEVLEMLIPHRATLNAIDLEGTRPAHISALLYLDRSPE